MPVEVQANEWSLCLLKAYFWTWADFHGEFDGSTNHRQKTLCLLIGLTNKYQKKPRTIYIGEKQCVLQLLLDKKEINTHH